MRLPRLIAAFALLLAACAPVGAQRLPHATGDLSAPASASPSPIAVVMSTYGSFQIKTQPLDTCALAIKVDPGSLGDGPPKTLIAKADLNGIVQWTYATPLIPAGHGRHDVACSGERGKSDFSAEFAVALKSLDAEGFTTRVQAGGPLAGVFGVGTRPPPGPRACRHARLGRGAPEVP